jgi:hypothetical protein
MDQYLDCAKPRDSVLHKYVNRARVGDIRLNGMKPITKLMKDCGQSVDTLHGP